MKTLIQNGILADPASGRFAAGNLLIADGRIPSLTGDAPPCDQVIDARGCIVSPGFIDIHMHEDPVDDQDRILPGISALWIA